MDVHIDGLLFERRTRTVLTVPSLTFASGSTTAIFGPNGAGKTSLLRLIGGLEEPTRGVVVVGGSRPTSDVGRANTAFAFQEAVFVRGTVRYNLALGLRFRGVPRPECDVRIAAVAGACGIGHLLERPAQELSGGEAQRANLARTLALRAPVTLLDEPLSGLDRTGRTRLLDDLPALLKVFAITTILVTHDREEAFRLAEDVVIVIGGRVRAAGPKAVVYASPPDRETAELLGYDVIDVEGECLAVPRDGFRIGEGPLALHIMVEEIVDMGDHRRVVGLFGDRRVAARVAGGSRAPVVGSRVRLALDGAVRLPRASHPLDAGEGESAA